MQAICHSINMGLANEVDDRQAALLARADLTLLYCHKCTSALSTSCSSLWHKCLLKSAGYNNFKDLLVCTDWFVQSLMFSVRQVKRTVTCQWAQPWIDFSIISIIFWLFLYNPNKKKIKMLWKKLMKKLNWITPINLIFEYQILNTKWNILLSNEKYYLILILMAVTNLKKVRSVAKIDRKSKCYKKNCQRNMLQLYMLSGNRSVKGMGIRRSPKEWESLRNKDEQRFGNLLKEKKSRDITVFKGHG